MNANMKSDECIWVKSLWMKHNIPGSIILLAYYYQSKPKSEGDSTHVWELRIFEEEPFVNKMKEYISSDSRIESFVYPSMEGYKMYMSRRKDWCATKGYFASSFLKRVDRAFQDWKTGIWESKTKNHPSLYPMDEYYFEDGKKVAEELTWMVIDKLPVGTVARRCSKKPQRYVKTEFLGNLGVPFIFE